MSDLPPPPGAPPPPPHGIPPPPPPASRPAYYVTPIGQSPAQLGGAYYSTGLVILLTIVTCGIWGALWTYRTSEDLKRYNGTGLGGVAGVLFYVASYVSIPLVIALYFTIPNEIQHMYERDGRQSPISTHWGWWVLLPIAGSIVWYVKVQRVLNEFWLSKGSRPG